VPRSSTQLAQVLGAAQSSVTLIPPSSNVIHLTIGLVLAKAISRCAHRAVRLLPQQGQIARALNFVSPSETALPPAIDPWNDRTIGVPQKRLYPKIGFDRVPRNNPE
jgi:hypothetical protein